MRTNGRYRKPGAMAVGVLLALAMGPAPSAQAGESASSRSRQEGIKVHGHWTIDIKNPDGSLVSHREFENALVDNGMTLAGLMGRLVSDLRWRVLLEGPGSDLPCVGAVGQLGNCYVIEPSDPLPASTAHAKNLQVLVPIYSSGKPVGTIELKGSITAGRAGSISTVQTEAHGNVADGQGGTIPLNQTFSRKTLAPQGVQPGQIVQISVVFSFS